MSGCCILQPDNRLRGSGVVAIHLSGPRAAGRLRRVSDQHHGAPRVGCPPIPARTEGPHKRPHVLITAVAPGQGIYHQQPRVECFARGPHAPAYLGQAAQRGDVPRLTDRPPQRPLAAQVEIPQPPGQDRRGSPVRPRRTSQCAGPASSRSSSQLVYTTGPACVASSARFALDTAVSFPGPRAAGTNGPRAASCNARRDLPRPPRPDSMPSRPTGSQPGISHSRSGHGPVHVSPSVAGHGPW